ncbi:MAG: polysaccharide deacetylase family protein [Gammaproteobacteria bacterium]
MISKIYLTIDDSPSIHTDKKVYFLRKHNISAIFYARGEFIEKYPNQIINAIQHGFIIGNHSYTHPYFSKISLTQCLKELEQTENLINECYLTSGIERPCKIVRFPFADRGAGPKAKEAVSHLEKMKVLELQSFLRKNDFKSLNFQPINSYLDSYWDWDTEDYKTKHISNKDLYLSKMHSFLNDYEKEKAVMLLHDFDTNHHLFEASMTFLLNKKIQFLDCHY